MNTEKLLNVLTWHANNTTQSAVYDWDAAYIKKEIKRNYESLTKAIQDEGLFDWNTLTVEDCKALRFKVWASKETVDEEIKFIRKRYDLTEDAEERRMYERDIERNKRTAGLWLIPLWLFGMIPEGIKLTAIDGEEFEFHKETADKDCRFGCLSYGIYPIDEKRYEDINKKRYADSNNN